MNPDDAIPEKAEPKNEGSGQPVGEETCDSIVLRAATQSEPSSAREFKSQEQNSTVSITDLAYSTDRLMNTGGGVSTQDRDLTGKTFAHKYQILERIGRGGMSVVYKANHLALGKLVAIKVLQLDRSEDELSLKRFRQEALAASALTHPSIVSVHDFGETEDGTLFLVMDYAEGQTLADIVKLGGPLPLERFLLLMQQIAEGLTVAHEKNVVHRDLKPSNVIVSTVNGVEQARLLDFGIAKVLSPDSESGQSLTQTGEIFGSPLYMSPEQCTGAIVDVRSDIYSLGCMMYECLSGKVPMIGDSVFETIHKHINAEPPPLVAPQIDPEFKGKLETILLRCLAKNKADRYQSVADITQQLKSLSLKAKPTLLAMFGGALEHASVKRRAAKRSRMPLMIMSLLSVSILSTVSVAALLQGQQQLNSEITKLNRSRELLAEIDMMQSAFITMGDSITKYFLSSLVHPGSQMEEARRKMMEKNVEKVTESLDRIEILTRNDKVFLTSFRRNWKGKLLHMPKAMKRAMSDASDGFSVDGRRLFGRIAPIYQDSIVTIRAMTEEIRAIEQQEVGQLSGTQGWIQFLSWLCVSLNATVVAVLTVYFAKGTPQRLQKLAEHASQLSRAKTGASAAKKRDEIADLDSVLYELANALTEAEEREKMLLQKLNEKDHSEAESVILHAAKATESTKLEV